MVGFCVNFRDVNMEVVLVNGNNQEVSIVGMGAYSPLGRDCNEMKSALLAGKDSISPVEYFSTDRFIGNLASTFDEDYSADISGKESGWMDKATIFAVNAYQEALLQSGLDLSEIDPERIAVCMGSSHCGLARTEDVVKKVLEDDVDSLDKKLIAATMVSNCTSVIKRMSGAKGPVMTISSACASSNSAIGVAAEMIRNGEADVAIAGGADSVTLSVMAGFNSLRAISVSKTAPFSNPIGLNIGEGAGVVILVGQKLKKQSSKSIAEVLGYALSGDAYHATSPDKDGAGAMQAMSTALSNSGIKASDIDYLNAHGTGTEANDSAESKAMLNLFGSNTPVSSTKSFMGHTLGASGVLELISTLLLANDGMVPQGLRNTELREGCERLDYIKDEPRKGVFNAIMINNFGFGGNNSSLVVRPSNGRLNKSLNKQKLSDVVLTGIGVVSSAGVGFGAFEDALNKNISLSNNENVSTATCPKLRFVDDLRPFARCAPATKFSLNALKESISNTLALYDHNPRAGLISGMFFGAQKSTEKYMESVFTADPAFANAHYFPMTTTNATGGACSQAFGISGYTTTVSGSAASLVYSANLTRNNNQDRMVAVSGDELTPILSDIFHKSGIVNNKLKYSRGRADSLGEFGISISLERADVAESRGAAKLATLVGWSQRPSACEFSADRDGSALLAAAYHSLEMAKISTNDISIISLLDQGLAPIFKSCQTVISELFKAPPRIIRPAKVFGYTASSGAMMTVAAAVSTLKKSEAQYVMALGYDLIGDAFTFIIKKD